jgi:hypothetical protein
MTIPVSSYGFDSEHMAVFLRLMRTIFRSLTGRLTRCYVSQDACGVVFVEWYAQIRAQCLERTREG